MSLPYLAATSIVSDRLRSYKAPYIFGMHRQDAINQYCDVVKNFLNYVLMHSVCPEYTKDIIAAQKVCELAKIELWKIHNLTNKFPGDFHKALSIICDGYFGRLYVDPAETAAANEKTGLDKHMSREQAHRILRAAVAFMGTQEQFIALTSLKVREAPKVIKEDLRGYEVLSITLPTQDLRKGFAGIKSGSGGSEAIKPLGLLECKRWVHPDQSTRDLTVAEERKLARNPPVLANETFWMEEDVLEQCIVGMKFFAMVRELSGGITYIDHVRVIYCSFYNWVENERMAGWKAPKENERNAPCCEDAEEVAGAEAEEDFGLDD